MTDNRGSTNSSGDEQFRAGDLLSDRYELISELGSGASAITWRARDRRLQRDVAVKILRRSYASDPTFAQRFDREARTAASVSHGNVVDIYDVGHDGPTLYLTMQYVAGEDLKHLVQREGALDPTRARDITLQVLAGLQAIHAAGIIHRDIKPQNVLIGRDDVAKVTDFGIAQDSVDVGLTTAGTTVGTAAYMAPEQARAETLSEATDLYAVGVMLYELLTGRLPFTGPTHMAMMLAHIQQEPTPPSQSGSGTSQYDGAVLQAMAKLPQDRFRSAQAMARALSNPPTRTGQATRVITSAAPATPLTTQAMRSRSDTSGAWPRIAAPPPARQAQAGAGGAQPTQAGSGVRFALWGFLLLIVLLLGAIGVYAYNEYVAGDSSNPPAEPLATRTPTDELDDDLPVVLATEEDESEEEAAPSIEPVDTEVPEEAPTDEPEPTNPPEPTDEPEPANEPTEEAPSIEPSEPTEEVEIIQPEATAG